MEFFVELTWFGQEKKTTMRLESRTIRDAGKEILRKINTFPQVVQNEIVSATLYAGDEVIGNFTPRTYNLEEEEEELEWMFFF